MSQLSKFLKNIKPNINLNFKFGGKKKVEVKVDLPQIPKKIRWYTPLVLWLIGRLKKLLD